MSNPFSPEAPKRRDPSLDNTQDVMEGARAKPNKKVAKPTPDLAERVQGIISDFVDRVKKAIPSNPPAATPR